MNYDNDVLGNAMVSRMSRLSQGPTRYMQRPYHRYDMVEQPTESDDLFIARWKEACKHSRS